mmetsp:Transcript_12530/g.30506  ORF Transcript_12530/g.30506 Transcript_12530/m.30506 type:complete len:317 (+) Transcript_12530:278-1228(+)
MPSPSPCPSSSIACLASAPQRSPHPFPPPASFPFCSFSFPSFHRRIILFPPAAAAAAAASASAGPPLLLLVVELSPVVELPPVTPTTPPAVSPTILFTSFASCKNEKLPPAVLFPLPSPYTFPEASSCSCLSLWMSRSAALASYFCITAFFNSFAHSETASFTGESGGNRSPRTFTMFPRTDSNSFTSSMYFDTSTASSDARCCSLIAVASFNEALISPSVDWPNSMSRMSVSAVSDSLNKLSFHSWACTNPPLLSSHIHIHIRVRSRSDVITTAVVDRRRDAGLDVVHMELLLLVRAVSRRPAESRWGGIFDKID